jgi:excisionase family DNA binding protein
MTFTLAEAADLMSCHRETLRRAIRNGSLRAAKLGREFRISRWDLEAFWKAGGGGDLFSKDESSAGPELPVPPAGKGPGKPKPMQLSLPGTGPDDGAER